MTIKAIKYALVSVIGISLTPFSNAQALYKCTDESGVTVIQNKKENKSCTSLFNESAPRVITRQISPSGKEAAPITAAVRKALKDPESARFGEITVGSNHHACVSVNAKNSFGGYEGERQAVAMKVNGRWTYREMLPPEAAHSICVTLMGGA